MPETTALYNGSDVQYVVRYSGSRFATNIIRSSTNISAPFGADNVDGISMDAVNYAVGNSPQGEIWYMSGQFTSTILNSVTQSSLSGSIVSISLDENDTLVKGNFTGSVDMTLFQGKVTSVILATFDPQNQSLYDGSGATKAVSLIKVAGVVKMIGLTTTKGELVHYRLSLAGDSFGSVLEDIENSPTALLGFAPTHMHYNGFNVVFTDSSPDGKTITQRAFFQAFTYFDDLGLPSFVATGGIDGTCSDAMSDRIVEEFSESVSNSFTFTDVANTPSTFFESVVNTVVFGQVAFSGSVDAEQGFEFLQEVSTAGSIYQRSIIHTMDLTDVASETLIETVTQTVTFSDAATITEQGIGVNTLNLTDAAVGVIVDLHAIQTINFSQIATVVGDVSESVTQSFIFTQTVASWLSTVSDCIYDPQPTRSIDFPVSTRANVTLSDNLPSPVNTINFRNPGFGNTESIELFRVLNVSRHRKRTIFRDSDWPKDRILNIVSPENTQAESVTMLDFLSATLGKEIKLIDWENRTWIGIITNPENVVRDLGTCRFQFNIEFLGTLIETDASEFDESISESLTLFQTVFVYRTCPPSPRCVPADQGFPPSGT